MIKIKNKIAPDGFHKLVCQIIKEKSFINLYFQKIEKEKYCSTILQVENDLCSGNC
jgi:hypothetical protein